MSIKDFIKKLNEAPNTLLFEDSMQVIETNYTFKPCMFKNGDLINEINQNNVSCKIFAFASIQELTKEQTLACFGEYYFNDVLKFPEKEGHQNIRNFMRFGWDNISFEDEFPLIKK